MHDTPEADHLADKIRAIAGDAPVELGLVLLAGTDIAIGDDGFGITLDAKRYFVDTTARWFAGDTLAIETEHKLDPWVVSAGVSYSF